MKKSWLTVAAMVSMWMSLTYAADPPQADRPAAYQAVTGRYAIYSGDLDEQQASTKNDRKLSLIIEGHPAKDIFRLNGARRQDNMRQRRCPISYKRQYVV